MGITKETPNPPGGLIQRDTRGNPTGLLIAEPNAYIVYSTIARAPRLSKADQINSSRHFMRELNRLGVTSVEYIDLLDILIHFGLRVILISSGKTAHESSLVFIENISG